MRALRVAPSSLFEAARRNSLLACWDAIVEVLDALWAEVDALLAEGLRDSEHECDWSRR